MAGSTSTPATKATMRWATSCAALGCWKPMRRPLPAAASRAPGQRPHTAAVAVLAIAGCGGPVFEGPALEGVPGGFELHPGFALELAAAEPVTVDPIDLAFDERGRAFVLELPGYPDMERPARIVELADRDGDGRWDHRRLFADDLGMADSILPWRRGLLVAAPPHIVYLEDTDGDGRADRRDVLLSGFAEGNPQHNVNALRYGLDNWIYGVNGGNGARVFWPEAPDEVGLPRAEEDIGQDDFRVDFGARRFERTGRGAGGFGMTFGPWGRVFGTHNLDHLSQVVVPRRYLDRLPAAWQDGRLRLAAPPEGGPAELFPIGVRQTRPNHPEQSRSFSAACSVTVYAGGAFDGVGLEEQGIQVFVADPSANVVHRAVVDTGGAAAAEAVRGRPGVEFLASTDPLFRPVNLTVGPDGSLYVLDMHRAVVEHPEWIPDRMEAELDLYEGDDRGRIYRIVPAGGLAPEQKAFGGLERSRPGELLEALSHPNRWRRLTAQRLLVEELAADPPEALVGDLRGMLENARPLGRLHALWTLSGLGELDRESLQAALSDPDPELRRNGVLAFEETVREDAPAGPLVAPAPRVVALIGDPDPGVRLQAMLTSGLLLRSEVGGAAALQGAAMAAVVTAVTSAAAEAPLPAESATGQRWLRLAAVSVLAGDPVGSLELLLPAGVPDGEVVERMATLLPAESLGEVMAGDLVRRVLSDSAGGRSGIGDALLAGLTAAAAGGGERTVDDSTLFGPLRRLRQSGDDVLAAAAWRLSAALAVEASAEEVGLLDCAGVRAANPAGGLEERLQALALFGLRRHWPAASEEVVPRCPEAAGTAETRAAETVPVGETWLERMGALLDADQPRRVQRAAMAELASADEGAVTAYLVERWPYLGPDARRDAGSYLIRSRSRHGALLDALESGRIGLGEMNFILERRRFLLRSPEPEIRRRAGALFDDAGVVTRAEAIEAMRPALEIDGDPERGEVLFLELCARCHRSGGSGSGPGPDLSGIGRKSAETLLNDILDPNAAVDAAYVNYVVETTGGEVHSGLLVESAGGGIVLRAAEDLLIEVPAERLREVRSDSLSMMPEELEAGLEPADMADLLAFLNR
ncbi:MAG: c-type cytochrome [Holophagales bacterium]|nr:c-type cytochrome [Holophagales bacterium]